MKLVYDKELKAAQDLKVEDQIEVTGLICTVKKVDNVFHHVPDAIVRLELEILGATRRRDRAILFLPTGTPVEVLS